MGIDERSRHDLYLGLEELMGTDRADALMGLLPPVGWADVATKHDLAALEARIDLRFEAHEQRLEATLQRELRAQLRTLLFGLLTALLTMTSLCLGAFALAR